MKRDRAIDIKECSIANSRANVDKAIVDIYERFIYLCDRYDDYCKDLDTYGELRHSSNYKDKVGRFVDDLSNVFKEYYKEE